MAAHSSRETLLLTSNDGEVAQPGQGRDGYETRLSQNASSTVSQHIHAPLRVSLTCRTDVATVKFTASSELAREDDMWPHDLEPPVLPLRIEDQYARVQTAFLEEAEVPPNTPAEDVIALLMQHFPDGVENDNEYDDDYIDDGDDDDEDLDDDSS